MEKPEESSRSKPITDKGDQESSGKSKAKRPNLKPFSKKRKRDTEDGKDKDILPEERGDIKHIEDSPNLDSNEVSNFLKPKESCGDSTPEASSATRQTKKSTSENNSIVEADSNKRGKKTRIPTDEERRATLMASVLKEPPSSSQLAENRRKWSAELEAIESITQNAIVTRAFLEYGFRVGDRFVEFDSNISVYESCFVALLIQAYVKDRFSEANINNNLIINVLEIGLAYGISAIIIINELEKIYAANKEFLGDRKYKYVVLDLNQSEHWFDFGMRNIESVQRDESGVEVTLYQESSTIRMPQLIAQDGENSYHIIFIDGSHDESIVFQDLMNADRLLVTGGLIILDDVLHDGVKAAILKFVKNEDKKARYHRVSVEERAGTLRKEKGLWDPNIHRTKERKRSKTNPSSMFCIRKE